MRVLMVVVLLAAPAAFACSLAAQPRDGRTLASGEPPPASVSSSDVTPPGAVSIQSTVVHLVHNGCDGEGMACPQLDSVTIVLSASDDKTAVRELRYVAAFGDSEGEAASAEPTLLFSADDADPNTVTAYLGFGRKRRGVAFERSNLCFTLAAVDEAGNVGPRSPAQCVDTVSVSGAAVAEGTPCATPGCTSAPGTLLCALLLALARRRG